MKRKPAPGKPEFADARVASFKRSKEEDSNARTLEVVASDETVDRYGDVVSADGWDLKAFRRNPIFLWQHDYGAPIGRVPRVEVVGKRLVASVDFAAPGVSDTADELWRLIEADILRAVSVGFTVHDPQDYEFIYDEDDNVTGYRFLRQELLELSLVAVPANPNALAIGRALNVSPSLLARALAPDASVINAQRASHARILQLRIRGQRIAMPRQAVTSTNVRGSRP